MEFSERNSSSPEKCSICLNPAWIKIEIIEDKQRTEKFVCVQHYTMYLEKYLHEELPDTILLFPKESKILEIPLYEAMERFGGLDEKQLLTQYLSYLEDKINNIKSELSQSADHFFATLLQNEKQDKYLRKLLTQSRLKQLGE